MYQLPVANLKRFYRSVSYYNNFLISLSDLINLILNSELPFYVIKLQNLLFVFLIFYIIGKADRKF